MFGWERLKILNRMAISVDLDVTARYELSHPDLQFANVSVLVYRAEIGNLFFSLEIPMEQLANRVDPDQTLQNAASDQGLHCLHSIQEFLET